MSNLDITATHALPLKDVHAIIMSKLDIIAHETLQRLH